MKQSDSITNLAKALAAVQQSITPVVKDRQNPHFKNNYATLDAIMESVRPLLAKNGLSIVQGGGSPVSNVDGNIVGAAVETMLVHASGEYITSAIVLPIDKGTPQAVGSAITYGRRYGVAALLALTTEEDDDGNHATATAANTASRPAPVTTTRTQEALANVPKPSGNLAGSAAKKMPFGKYKGTPLGELDTRDLDSTIQWCSSDGEKAEKFKDLIAACNEVLADRAAAEEPEPIPF